MKASVHKPTIAFQGEPGAFSEDAAIELFGAEVIEAIELKPCRTFEDLFASAAAGHADYILLPVENSLIGTIQPAVDLFEESSLTVVGEVAIPIRHHLIGCPGSLFEEIESVDSHPAALAQCRRFFAAAPQLKPVETDDTAGSVARMIKRGDRSSAAIAGRRAAELYGGTILRSNIEDSGDNHTRFLLLARENKAIPRGSTNTEPGADAVHKGLLDVRGKHRDEKAARRGTSGNRNR
ncbi:MAG TPA: prephenate dehydratase domain-containing protein [Pyrinomonadaceae bacterium]|nr:prephenate dehydratase domain-containing protein [Pyrinomonadaceae bacterium]